MAQQIQPNQIDQSLRLLQINYPTPEVVRNVRSQKDANKVEQTFKEIVTYRRRKLAKSNHPDAGGSVEKMKAINAAADLLLGIKFQIRPVRRPVNIVYYNYNYHNAGTSYTSTTSSNGW